MSNLTNKLHELEDNKKNSLGGTRREVLTAAVARAMVLVGWPECLRPETLAEHVPAGFPLPVESQASELVGGTRGARARIRQGGLFEPEELAPWTGGFLRGLSLNGAWHPRSGRPYILCMEVGRLPALEHDLAGAPLSLRVSPPRPNRTLDVSGFHAALLPADDPEGADVLAGVLAGACTECDARGEWLRVAFSAEGLLDLWCLHFDRGRRGLLVSPFYGAVLSRRMPPACRERMLSFDSPAMCPLLPAVAWHMALRKADGSCGLPFTGALPYGSVRQVLARKGWGVKQMSKAALEVFGLTSVHPPWREELRACYEARRDALNAGAGIS
jgi:hypothetical protein